MITFDSPLLLLLLIIPVFFLPLFLRWLTKKYVWQKTSFSSLKITRRAGMLRSFFSRLPQAIFYIVLCLGIILLAHPRGESTVKKVTDIGQRIVLAFDVSGSMKYAKLNAAKKASIKLIDKRKDDVFSVLPFSDTVHFVDGVSFTTDRSRVKEAILKLEASGATAFGDGLLGALWFVFADVHEVRGLNERGAPLVSFEELHHILSSNDAVEKKRLVKQILTTFGSLHGAFIVAVTDTSSSHGVPPEDVVAFAGRLGVPMYVIGVGLYSEPRIKDILVQNGGAYFNADSAADLEKMYEVINRLRPTTTSVIYVPERKSMRPQLFIAICLCLLVASAIRATFLTIE